MNEITERAKKLVVRNHWIQVGRQRERERIIRMLQERGLMAEKQVSDGDGWSFGRYNELMDIIDLIKGDKE